MQIPINDTVFQSQIFIAFFVLVCILTFKKREPYHFDNSLTEELKGFSMLAIVFSHIGYFLIADHRFLFPLSVAAGVGVNLFLLLSGYGLTISAIKKPLSILDFYKKRLLKLLIPLWMLLAVFFILDYFFLHITYPVNYVIQSFSGIYLTSNPAADIDSPLWYFTLILFFYVIFPLVFRKSKALLSGLFILVLIWGLLQIPLPLHADNFNLYQLHFLAFPLGIIIASVKDRIRWKRDEFLRWGLLLSLCLIFGYFSYYSGVGQGKVKEQAISIFVSLLAISIFLLKNFQIKFFNLVGRYSYEIYLLHWPIMFRFENLYQFMPASIATVLYLMEFIVLASLVQKITQRISPKT